MPLPQIGGTWPPQDQQPIYQKMNEWQAWWAGDTTGLANAYAGQSRPSFAARGGVVGAVRRFWHGQAQTAGQVRDRLHVPLAADICQASGDLLFAEPITVTADDETAQEVLDTITEDGFHSTLATAAEISAALGGTYLRIVWDADVLDHVFLDTVDADYAVPEFRWSRLRAVTFYFIVKTDGQTTWRHAERHEIENGVGVVYHGLYQGTASELGRLVPLTEADATAGLADDVDADGRIDTGSPGLAAAYIPNVLPNRVWRKHPVGRNLGRSDLDQLEPLLDALDEVYASWMRDIRLGKARIIAGRTMLTDHGPGDGAGFDLDREVYEGVNVPPGAAKDSGLDLEHIQFAIRYAEHLETAKELTRLILRTAGYSASTFGDHGDGGMETATGVHARDRRTTLTKGRKERHWVTGLQRLLTKALDINATVFGGPGSSGEQVVVTFPDGAQDSQVEIAQTVQLLHSAQAASTRVRVQMAHPDWDKDTVDDEVEDIMREFSLDASADPDTIGLDGYGLSNDYGPVTDPTVES